MLTNLFFRVCVKRRWTGCLFYTSQERHGVKVRYRAVQSLGILNTLFSKAERIVVVTDAGREGEIFRNICQYLDCHAPFERLWSSSLTERAICEGLQHPPGE